MATTITLQKSVDWAKSFLGWRPLTVGVGNEPALTSANLILQTIIGPPFAWNWNRNSTTFFTTQNVQDYVQALSDFGFIEKASYVAAADITNVSLTSNVATYTAANSFAKNDIVNVTGLATSGGDFNVTNATITSASATQFTVALVHANVGSTPDTGVALAGKISEIPNMENVLASGKEPGTPNYIAPQIDDNAGNITFRLLPVPDGKYQITVVYQKRIPSLMTTISSTWAPIPDHYSYVYQHGFLSLMAAYANDARWASFNSKFVGALLSVADGLEEEQKNIFMNAWLQNVTQMQLAGLKSQQGTQARGI